MTYAAEITNQYGRTHRRVFCTQRQAEKWIDWCKKMVPWQLRDENGEVRWTVVVKEAV